MTDKLAKVREKMLLTPEEIMGYSRKQAMFPIDWCKAQQDKDFNTPIVIEGKCPECLGAKMLWDSLSHRMDYPCPTCKGTGRLPDKTKTLWEWAKLGMEMVKDG